MSLGAAFWQKLGTALPDNVEIARITVRLLAFAILTVFSRLEHAILANNSAGPESIPGQKAGRLPHIG
jgi:hypothetical protein